MRTQINRAVLPDHLRMIDINTEQLIPILAVRETLPISVATLRRLTATGKLETIRVGAKVFTSREAVARMVQHGPQQTHQTPLPPTRRQQARSRGFDQAKSNLKAALGNW
jgi:hypothetical protein